MGSESNLRTENCHVIGLGLLIFNYNISLSYCYNTKFKFQKSKMSTCAMVCAFKFFTEDIMDYGHFSLDLHISNVEISFFVMSMGRKIKIP